MSIMRTFIIFFVRLCIYNLFDLIYESQRILPRSFFLYSFVFTTQILKKKKKYQFFENVGGLCVKILPKIVC